MARNKYLITSALPYVNNVPHLGNIIGCVLSADVYARYRKTHGDEYLFICGTDEYGTATETKALEQNMTCQEICDYYYKIHKEIYDWFNIEFDIFGRTTTETQTQLAQEIFLELYKNGYIFEKTISQLYCQNCQRFLADRYINGYCYTPDCQINKIKTKGDQCDSCGTPIDPLRLIEPTCIICNKNDINIKKSEHLFLDLAKFQEKLEQFIPTVNLLNNSANIAQQWLKQGLHERCITRDLNWGTPVPTPPEYPGYPELAKFKGKVFYVWFDAPIGYFSILMHALGKEQAEKQWLKNQHTKLVQFMAKDNVSFHTVMFPATLMGYNENKEPFTLIHELNCTEYLQYNGGKFSKSQGLGIFGDQVRDLSIKHDISVDVWRAYLIYIRPENQDTSFDLDAMKNFNKSFLCDKLGNYVNRTFILAEKYTQNRIYFHYPLNFGNDKITLDLFRQLRTLSNEYEQYFEHGKIRDAFKTLFKLIDVANKWLYQKEPWKLYKENIITATNIIALAINICYLVGLQARPFMPNTAHIILNSVENGTNIKHYMFPGLNNLCVKKPPLLFRPLTIN